MADLRYPKERPHVRIYLHQADIHDMMMQPGVLHYMATERLQDIIMAIKAELERREDVGELIERERTDAGA